MNKNYIKIEFIPGSTIEEAVGELLVYKETDMLVCGNFNGITLYSDTVSIDSAYKQITGRTKIDFENNIKQLQEKRLKKKNDERELTDEGLIKVGDIVTFSTQQKRYMSQKVTVVERIDKDGLIFTEGNVKPLQPCYVRLVCKKENREVQE